MTDPRAIEAAKRWTIRVCRECGGHHGRCHDGCVTHSHSMFPQNTEWAGVDEVEVVPCEVADRLAEALDAVLTRAEQWKPEPELSRAREALAEYRAAKEER